MFYVIFIMCVLQTQRIRLSRTKKCADVILIFRNRAGAKSHCVNRGSYMSARVLLSLLSEYRKIDKMRDLSSILSFFSQRL